MDTKKLLAAFFAISMALIAFSQGSSHHYIGLSIGPDIPVGDFKKKDISDSTSGFANTGLSIKVNYTYDLNDYIGFTGIISYGYNNLNTTSLRNQFEDLLLSVNPSLEDLSINVATTRSWNTGNFMVGPVFKLPFAQKFSWVVRGTAGLAGSYSPEFTLDATFTQGGQQVNSVLIRRAARSYSFIWNAGTGFRFAGRNRYILLFVDYQSTKATFDEVLTIDGNNNTTQTSFEQQLDALVVSIGLGWYL